MSSTPQTCGRLHGLELRVPPLPQTLPEVLALLNGAGLADPGAVAEIVERDPAAAARLLQKVNSAYYGLRRSVSDLTRAVHMIGPNSAIGTVITLNMLKLRRSMEGPAGACLARLVRHSVGTAFLARHLLRQLPPGGGAVPDEQAAASDGFTEGLLHDFGKIALVYNFPEEAAALYEAQSMTQHVADRDERALEQLAFGYDHTEAGAYAASTLHFPPPLVDLIRYHHAPEQFDGPAGSTLVFRAVRAANRALKAMGHALSGPHATAAPLGWEACAAHPVWAPWRAPAALGADVAGHLRAQRETLVRRTAQFLNAPAGPAAHPS